MFQATVCVVIGRQEKGQLKVTCPVSLLKLRESLKGYSMGRYIDDDDKEIVKTETERWQRKDHGEIVFV